MTVPASLSGFYAALLVGLTSIAGAAPVYATDQAAGETIHIAAYEFPPYYSSNLDKHLLGSLLQALNQRQQTYYFSVIEVRPTQRHRALQDGGCCDLMLFEDPQWGWQELLDDEFVAGAKLTHGADLYLSAEDPMKVLQGDVTIGGVQGYHYQLTGYQHDTDLLEREHSLYLADNQLTLLNMLRRERLEVVIVSQELMRFLYAENSPLVADVEYQMAVDQEYQTRIIARRDKAELVRWLEDEFTAMWHEGELEEVFLRFGLTEHLRFHGGNGASENEASENESPPIESHVNTNPDQSVAVR